MHFADYLFIMIKDNVDNNTNLWALPIKSKLKRIDSELRITNMVELFENLSYGRATAEQVKNRVIAFITFIKTEKSGYVLPWLRDLVKNAHLQLHNAINDPETFYNTDFFLLASYLFKIRLVLYIERNGGLATQYFGHVKYPKIRVFNTGSQYFLVCKINSKRPTKLRTKRNSFDQLKTQDSSPRIMSSHPLNKKSLRSPTRLSFSISTSQFDNLEDIESNKQHINNLFSNSVLSADLFENTIKSPGQLDTPNEKKKIEINNSVIENEDPNQKSINSLFCFSPSVIAPKDEAGNDTPVYIPPTFKDKILFESQSFSIGKLKFYNEQKGFGFIVSSDGKDIFVHKDDLLRANINTCQLEYMKGFYDIILRYRYIEYKGKVKNNNKAIDIHIVEVNSLV